MMRTLTLLLLMSGCSLDTPITTDLVPTDPVIYFYLDVAYRKIDDEYVDVDHVSHIAPITGEKYVPDFQVLGKDLLVEPFNCTQRDVEVRVTYGDEVQTKKIMFFPLTEFLFADDHVKVRIQMQSNTLPPMPVGTIGESVEVRLMHPANEDERFMTDEYEMLPPKRLTKPNNLQRIRNLVETNGYIQPRGADCFDPGFAINVATPEKPRYVKVCLDCWNISVDAPDQDGHSMYYGLNETGLNEMKTLYREAL